MMKLADIPKYLKTWRMRRGLNQGETAKLAYMGQAQLSRIETGEGAVVLEKLQRVAEGLGLALHIEFTDLDDKNPLQTLRDERDKARVERDAALQLMRVYLDSERRMPEMEEAALGALTGVLEVGFGTAAGHKNDGQAYVSITGIVPETGKKRELYRVYVFALDMTGKAVE